MLPTTPQTLTPHARRSPESAEKGLHGDTANIFSCLEVCSFYVVIGIYNLGNGKPKQLQMKYDQVELRIKDTPKTLAHTHANDIFILMVIVIYRNNFFYWLIKFMLSELFIRINGLWREMHKISFHYQTHIHF